MAARLFGSELKEYGGGREDHEPDKDKSADADEVDVVEQALAFHALYDVFKDNDGRNGHDQQDRQDDRNAQGYGVLAEKAAGDGDVP